MFRKGIGYLSNHSVGKAGTILPKMYLSNTVSINELRSTTESLLTLLRAEVESDVFRLTFVFLPVGPW